MRHRHRMGIMAAAAVLVAVPFVRADCLAALKPVSSIGVFPNRFAAPLASTGSILGLAKADFDTSTNAITFATYGSDLSHLTGDVTVASSSLKGPASLFWTESEFGLFYQTSSRILMLQRLDLAGNLIGGPVALANHAWSSGDEFDIAWLPSRNAYAIARTVTAGSGLGLWLTVVSPAGGVLFDTNISSFTSAPTLPRVIGLQDGTAAVAWVRPADPPILILSLVSPAGTVSSTAIAQRALTDLRVATNGASVLVIASAPRAGGGTELRSIRAGATGSVLTPDSLFLTGSGVDVAPLSLIWNPTLSEWALTYVDARIGLSVFPGDTRLRRFAATTGPSSDTLLAPDPVYSRLGAPFPPVFVNGGYVASIARLLSRAEGSESYLVRLCPFFVTASADHPIWRPFVTMTFSAVPSGGSPGYTYQWDFGDLSFGTGAVTQHAYNLPGTYTVTVTGTDAAGGQSIDKLTVQVLEFLRRRAVR